MLDSDVDEDASLASKDLHDSNMEQPAPPSEDPHYFVHILDAPESTYDAYERNISIDLDFHKQLQQEGEEKDITTFLALLEIIPARKQKRQQPVLDSTKSKIFTSNAYTERCEQLLAQW